MDPIHFGDKSSIIKKVQISANSRLRAREATGHIVQPDGEAGPKTLDAVVFACYLLGMATTKTKAMRKQRVITPEAAQLVRNPGKRNSAQLKAGRQRVAAHRIAVKKAKDEALKAGLKRRRVVAEAKKAAANYRKDPGAYHYLAGGVANLIYLHPSPRNYRSDCSQFAASVYKGAGLPSPASVPHEWASTYTIVKCPQARVVDRAHRKPGMLGMYGSRTAPHHVEIWCGDEFVGHGSPPIDSLTPGEPDFYIDFDFLN